jgi:hypothetical protein
VSGEDPEAVARLFEAAMTDLGFRAAESAAVRDFVEAAEYRLALDALRAVAEAKDADPIGWLMRIRREVSAGEMRAQPPRR